MNTMTAIQTNAKGLKKAMKVYGVNVLRCSQNKKGAIITIEGSIENQKKAIIFFDEFEMYCACGLKVNVTKSDKKYIDYGTMFNMQYPS